MQDRGAGTGPEGRVKLLRAGPHAFNKKNLANWSFLGSSSQQIYSCHNHWVVLPTPTKQQHIWSNLQLPACWLDVGKTNVEAATTCFPWSPPNLKSSRLEILVVGASKSVFQIMQLTINVEDQNFVPLASLLVPPTVSRVFWHELISSLDTQNNEHSSGPTKHSHTKVKYQSW